MELTDVENALPGLMGGISESASTTTAPELDFSSLYGDAPYEGRETATPSVAAEPEPAKAPDEIAAMRARVEQLEGYARQVGEVQEERNIQWQRSQETAGAYQQAYQQAAQTATLPELNPDDYLGDPKKFTALCQELVNRGVRATMAALGPATNELREARAAAATTMRRSQEAAMEAAKAHLDRANPGLGEEFDTTDQRAIAARLRRLGPDGEYLLADPAQIANAYVMARMESGRGLAPRSPQRAPSAAPAQGSRRPTRTGKVSMDRLPQAAKDVFRTLRIPTQGDFGPDEIAMLREGGIL
jgi:hypothetical protein